MLISEAKGKLKVGDRVRMKANIFCSVPFEAVIKGTTNNGFWAEHIIDGMHKEYFFDFQGAYYIDILPKRGRHIPRSELKVGMVVVCGDEKYDSGLCWMDKNREHVPFKITSFNEYGKVLRRTLDGNQYGLWDPDGCSCDALDHLYLWEGEEPTSDNQNSSYWYPTTLKYLGLDTYSITNQPNKSLMTNVIELFRKLTLSNEDKLMTELGLENPAGTPTQDGIQILLETIYAERRADIIKKAELIKTAMEEGKK